MAGDVADDLLAWLTPSMKPGLMSISSFDELLTTSAVMEPALVAINWTELFSRVVCALRTNEML